MAQYLSFVAFAAVLAIAPGPDTFLTLRASAVGGRGRGLWTAAGISTGGAAQGVLAATGLGAVIAHARPVFLTIRWAGVAYLVWLAVCALWAAVRREPAGWSTGRLGRRTPWGAFRTGLLCNITNPKVLAFNLAVLPQFVGSHAGLGQLLAYALTLTAVGAVVLLAVIVATGAANHALSRTGVRRGIEATTSLVMLGFAGALAVDNGV